MDLYQNVAYELSRHLTLRYSSSFGTSSRLFTSDIRRHIYAVYGLVRIADEIVDTYKGPDAEQLLDDLERETTRSIKSGYSANPIVQSFAISARQYTIDESLIQPFFASMRFDLTPQTYTDQDYQNYIYGSAEVVGLMCLKVFTKNDPSLYSQLEPGARALGAAYQKVNFLRDMAADYHQLGRVYFPGVNYETFSQADKDLIVKDIRSDFQAAKAALKQLPKSCRPAVALSYLYYSRLLDKLDQASIETIKSDRLRLGKLTKISLLIKARLGLSI